MCLFLCFFVSLFLCLMSPFHVIFSRGGTGAEHASSVDWCDLNLDLDLEKSPKKGGCVPEFDLDLK